MHYFAQKNPLFFGVISAYVILVSEIFYTFEEIIISKQDNAMRRIFSFAITLIFAASLLQAADPTATRFSLDDCRGTYKPYPVPRQAVECPDSLTPVFINHIGRHGSRFPASAKDALTLLSALRQADSIGTITPKGRSLMALTEHLIAKADGRWGALDSLGMAEQRGIASRMYANFPSLFADRSVQALSSYSPRCIMSMYEFTHQLARLNNRVEISTTSGRQTSPLLRYFDTDADFLDFRRSKASAESVDAFFAATATSTPISRILGEDFLYDSAEDPDRLSYVAYRVISSMAAAGIGCNLSKYFTIDEANALWACANIKHYLDYSATTPSTIPADAAAPLLLSLITTTDAATTDSISPSAILRFCHAETILPLLALMRLDGCYYLTNYFDTVARNWQDFHIAPMAANLQMILFQADSGTYYLRVDLNETPIPLIPGTTDIYIPWSTAQAHLLRFIPLHLLP